MLITSTHVFCDLCRSDGGQICDWKPNGWLFIEVNITTGDTQRHLCGSCLGEIKQQLLGIEERKTIMST